MFKSIARISVFFLSVACTDAQSGISVSETDSIGIRILNIHGLPENLEHFTLGEPIGTLEVPDSANLPGFTTIVGGRFLSNGLVALGDRSNSTIYIFDNDDRFYGAIGRWGDGPGEFRSLAAISVLDPDTLAAFDLRNGRMTLMTPGGDIFREWNVNRSFRANLAIASPDGSGLYLLDWQTQRRSWPTDDEPMFFPRSVCLWRQDSKGDLGPNSYCVPAATEVVVGGMSSSPVFRISPKIAAQGTELILSPGAEFEIIRLDQDLRPLEIVRWPDSDRPISDSDLEEVRNMLGPEARPSGEAGFIEATFSGRALPDVKPAIGRIVVDDRGRFWVGLAGPFRFVSPTWYVIASDGYPLGQVLLPPRSEILDVRGNEILVIHLDSMDIPVAERFQNPVMR